MTTMNAKSTSEASVDFKLAHNDTSVYFKLFHHFEPNLDIHYQGIALYTKRARPRPFKIYENL